MINHGLGQIASFCFEHPTRGRVWMEVEVLWTWWIFCYVELRRSVCDYEDNSVEWFEPRKYRFLKFWWNLGYFPLEER